VTSVRGPIRGRVLARLVVPAVSVAVLAGLVGLAHGGAESASDLEPASAQRLTADLALPLTGGASSGQTSEPAPVVDAELVQTSSADPLAGPGADPEPDVGGEPPRTAAATFAGQRAAVARAASLVGTSLRVVGLGDSVPAGTSCHCDSYVTLVARGLAGRTRQVAVLHNLAEPGITTRDVLDRLEDPVVRQEIADADLVVLTVGANDFDPRLATDPRCQPNPVTGCYRRALAGERSRLGSVLSRLRALQAAHGGTTVMTGYWNVFLDGAAGAAEGATYVRQSNRLSQALNASIAAVAAGRARYVDLYAPFKAKGSGITRLLARDGDHPNAAGHRLIAALILAAVG
jgi:lysophospholipase L1-like esterase